MNVIDNAVNFAINIANDNSHGYSMVNRNGNPDYDCSSLVIACYRNAGLKLLGASYTGNMYLSFISEGFVDVKSSINMNTGDGLQKGDVLLNTINHTCIYIGNGKVVNARTDTDGVAGDSHGDEIRIQNYWNYNPWDYVLRYTKDSSSTIPTETDKILIPTGTKGVGIAMLQGGLKYLGYNLGWYGIDGDAGNQNSYTNKALRQALSQNKINEDIVNTILDFNNR